MFGECPFFSFLFGWIPLAYRVYALCGGKKILLLWGNEPTNTENRVVVGSGAILFSVAYFAVILDPESKTYLVTGHLRELSDADRHRQGVGGRGGCTDQRGENAEKILLVKPHTASRRNAKAERFCCRHVWIVEQVMTWA